MGVFSPCPSPLDNPAAARSEVDVLRSMRDSDRPAEQSMCRQSRRRDLARKTVGAQEVAPADMLKIEAGDGRVRTRRARVNEHYNALLPRSSASRPPEFLRAERSEAMAVVVQESTPVVWSGKRCGQDVG